MKKIITLFILLSSILGCSNKQNIQYDIQSFDLTKLSQISDIEYEILRVTHNKIILNELNTFNDPFLFTTKSIVILNQDGQQDNKYIITTNKRIVDFIEYRDNLYYFNLIENNEKFYIELCIFENNKEKVIKTYSIEDPYAYPRFIQYNNKYYYKLNNNLFNLENPNDFIELKSVFFLSKNDINNDSVYLKVKKDSNYQLCILKDEKPEALKFQENFGNFIVIYDSIIYQNNDDHYLYLHDLKNEKEVCLFDQEKVSDFALLKNDIVVVHTENIIYFINIKENKVINSINKKEKSLENTIDWIYSDGINQIYLIDNKNIYKITLNL